MSKFVSIFCGRKELEVQKLFDDMMASPIPRQIPEEAKFMIKSPLLDLGTKLLVFGTLSIVVCYILIYLAVLLLWNAHVNCTLLTINTISLFLCYLVIWSVGYMRKQKSIKVLRFGKKVNGRITGMSRKKRFLSLRRPYIQLAMDVEYEGRHYECRTYIHFLELSRIAQMADSDSPVDVLFIPGCREVVVPVFYAMHAKYANLI